MGLLLSTFLLMRPAVAEEPGYDNISVQQARHLIKHTENVVILDVRNQSEYDLGHLYGAELIPLASLENKTMPIDIAQPPANDTVMLDVYQRIMSSFNLSAHVNDPIVVYCKGGARSAPACEILVEHGFTQVYNVLGGITAWMQADYEIYTSNHYVTVDFDDELIDIQPLLLYQANCNSCQTCSTQSVPTTVNSGNFTAFEILQNTTNTLAYMLTYELDGNITTMIVNRTQLWRYDDSLYDCNRTALLESIEMVISSDELVENITAQSFNIAYTVKNSDYKVALRTTLQYPTNESYGTAYTVFGYAPNNKTAVLSVENVQFNSSVTLSDHYRALGKVSKQLAHLYDQSESYDLSRLSIGYNIMHDEATNLATLVNHNLATYDKPILNCSATLVDSACTDLCGYTCGIITGIACGAICAGISVPCGPAYPACFGVCLGACGAGLSGYLCTWLCYQLCGEEASVEDLGCGTVCGGICAYCPDEAGYLCWLCDQFCNTLCHDLWPDNPDPEPEPFADYWGSSVYSTDTWGYGYVYNSGYIVGEMPDGNCAELLAYDDGSMARIIVTMNSQATGEVIVNGYSEYGYDSRMIVYVSSDAYNWDLIYDNYISNTSPDWIYCGYSSNFNYVIINVYSDYYTSCDLFVDNVCVVYSDPPVNEYYVGQSVSWTNTYGAGSAVNNPWNMLSDPNGNYGQLYAPNYGCTARVSIVLNEPAVGNIGVYGYSVSGYYSLFYVYVSNDDYNWNFVSSQVVSSSTPSWINFGVYAANFRYVLLIGYDSGNSVNLQIDAVRVTP